MGEDMIVPMKWIADKKVDSTSDIREIRPVIRKPSI
jgi:hypothetical protein